MLLLHCPYGHDAKFKIKVRKYANIEDEIIICAECGHEYIHRVMKMVHTTGPDMMVIGHSKFEEIVGDFPPGHEHKLNFIQIPE